MAYTKNYLANAGAVDVARLMQAFEEGNNCALTVTMSPVLRRGTTDLLIIVSSHTIPAAGVEPVPLASLDFYRSSHNFLTLDSVIIYALYQMDARLEDLRWNKTPA
jgi:hypothetical protein